MADYPVSQGSSNVDNLFDKGFPVETEAVTLQSGSTYSRGDVLGTLKNNVPTTGTADGGNTGNGTCTAVTGGKNSIAGTYTIECVRAVTNGGEFRLTNPDGEFVGDILITAGAGGTGVLKTDEINLTITDGSTDFILADKFTILVSSGVPSTGTADGGNTGNGTMTAVIGAKYTKTGTYTITCITAATNGGVFSVTDPDSVRLPNATVAVTYLTTQLGFLLNDGGTDFIVGDEFTLAVAPGALQAKLVDSSATDGTQVARYILLDRSVDATSAAKKAVAALTGMFNEGQLTFGGTDTIETHRAEMRDKGLYTGDSIPQTGGQV